jgi:hypothetical protein
VNRPRRGSSRPARGERPGASLGRFGEPAADTTIGPSLDLDSSVFARRVGLLVGDANLDVSPATELIGAARGEVIGAVREHGIACGEPHFAEWLPSAVREFAETGFEASAHFVRQPAVLACGLLLFGPLALLGVGCSRTDLRSAPAQSGVEIRDPNGHWHTYLPADRPELSYEGPSSIHGSTISDRDASATQFDVISGPPEQDIVITVTVARTWGEIPDIYAEALAQLPRPMITERVGGLTYYSFTDPFGETDTLVHVVRRGDFLLEFRTTAQNSSLQQALVQTLTESFDAIR